MKNEDPPRRQYAALPWRRRAGEVEVMLLTSRETRRWIIPKGWPARGLPPHDSAAREAREEGGVVGTVSTQSIGCFHYAKRLPDGSAAPCEVDVFLLEVREQLPAWPEQAERTTRWFAPEEAAQSVQEEELAALIRNLSKRIG